MENNQPVHPRVPSISVFFPAYNDEGSIAELVHGAFALAQSTSVSTGRTAYPSAEAPPALRVVAQRGRKGNEGFGGMEVSGRHRL